METIPAKCLMSLILSGSISINPVYSVNIVPNTATDIADMMIVRILFPSHTISIGASADLGRLFRTTI